MRIRFYRRLPFLQQCHCLLSIAYLLIFLLRECTVLGFVKPCWKTTYIALNSQSIDEDKQTKVLRSEDPVIDKAPTGLNKADQALFYQPSSKKTKFISTEKIQELQSSINIVSFLERAYNLPKFSRTGQFKATCLCPFHDDSNPSLSIDATRGIYKCFACGAGGNVFSFVREYSKTQGGEEVSFVDAVRYVEEQTAASDDNSMIIPPGTKEIWRDRPTTLSSSGEKASMGNKNHTKAFQTSKMRVTLANAAAATFYEKSLGSASAGLARKHLRERGMQPRTIRAFAIGYAPDVYFKQERKLWGENSLVEYLQRKGFTSQEIVDSGLATILKKDIPRIQIQQKEDKKFQIPFSSLMNRFRGRLMVPIFDSTGLQVLGFGGRILETPPEMQEKFIGPKYLNSPESPIFSKKNVLFGQHMASKALKFWDKEEHIARSVIIVEGYMDCIALWQVGVREAVACMGTGLTVEQITAAAMLAGNKNGRVVLCLDNDDAGIAAVERLCRSGILASVAETHPVQFCIARLPPTIKDPADYIDAHKNDAKVDELFREQVLEKNSMDWLDWYQEYSLKQYNNTAENGERGSFSDILDRLGGLLAMVKKEDQRKSKFDDIVDTLALTVAENNNQTGVSEATRLQLEGELERKMTMVSARASSLPSKSFSVKTSPDGLQKTLARMAPQNEDLNERVLGEEHEQKSSPTSERRRFRPVNDRQEQRPAFTPHFSGFTFENKDDIAWIDDASLSNNSHRRKKFKKNDDEEDPVYFNSNKYHGETFITEEALRAGYTNTAVTRDPELLVKGINSMVGVNTNQVLCSAENDLLRCLLSFPSARESISGIISLGESTGSSEEIPWTSPEKAWLFDRLIASDSTLKAYNRTNLPAFQRLLAELPDVVPGSFSISARLLPDSLPDTEGNFSSILHVDDVQKSAQDIEALNSNDDGKEGIVRGTQHEVHLLGKEGSLDQLFTNPSVEDEIGLNVSDEDIALRVQEAYYTMLWASSSQKLNEKHNEWAILVLSTNETNNETTANDDINTTMMLSIDEDTAQRLRVEIQQLSEQVRLLSGALHGLSKRLIQRTMPTSISKTWRNDYDALSERLTKHMDEIGQLIVDRGLDEDLRDEETYEAVLERCYDEWGELYEDEEFWSPDKISKATTPLLQPLELVENQNEVSMEEFDQRIDEEWGWLDEVTPNVDTTSELELYDFDEESWDSFLSSESQLDHNGPLLQSNETLS